MKMLPRYSSWSIIYEKLVATIGQDPCVNVECITPLECNKYCIRIRVIGRAKAEAIRKLVPKEYCFGNIEVITIVLERDEVICDCFCPANARQIANTICIGLQGNYLYQAVALPNSDKCICPTIKVLIVPKYIRLWGPSGNCTYEEFAPNLFAEVLRREIGYLIKIKIFYTCYNAWEICDDEIYCTNRLCRE